MTITPDDVIKLLLWLMAGSTATLAGVLGFLGRAMVRRLAQIEALVRSEMRMFDRRMTRVETKIGLVPWTHFDGERTDDLT
jgi:nucleoside-diphosphate-sugar epimerase